MWHRTPARLLRQRTVRVAAISQPPWVASLRIPATAVPRCGDTGMGSWSGMRILGTLS
jgi:hypothetical protein